MKRVGRVSVAFLVREQLEELKAEGFDIVSPGAVVAKCLEDPLRTRRKKKGFSVRRPSAAIRDKRKRETKKKKRVKRK